MSATSEIKTTGSQKTKIVETEEEIVEDKTFAIAYTALKRPNSKIYSFVDDNEELGTACAFELEHELRYNVTEFEARTGFIILQASDKVSAMNALIGNPFIGMILSAQVVELGIEDGQIDYQWRIERRQEENEKKD